jgi:hypothetical protein
MVVITIVLALWLVIRVQENMFVTESLNGRLYQSYVPKPLVPTLEKAVIEKFKALDRQLTKSLTQMNDAERTQALIANQQRQRAVIYQIRHQKRLTAVVRKVVVMRQIVGAMVL